MLLPYDVVEDVIPHNIMLQYIVLADVIANGRWNSHYIVLADVIASGRWNKPLQGGGGMSMEDVITKWQME